jgi:hypothetical protein
VGPEHRECIEDFDITLFGGSNDWEDTDIYTCWFVWLTSEYRINREFLGAIYTRFSNLRACVDLCEECYFVCSQIAYCHIVILLFISL